MLDEVVLRQRQKANGDARQEEGKPHGSGAFNGHDHDAEPQSRIEEKAKVDLPKGFIPESEMRPAAPAQLIKKTLPLLGTSLGIGQSGAGKTAVFLDMACAITSGTPFFGREVRNKGGVVYIAAEGAGGLNNRINAAKLPRGIDLAIPLIGRPGSCNLKDENELAELISDLRQINAWFQQEFGLPLCLTIIDTMSAAFALENENDNAEVARICKCLKRIGEETGAHALGIHHAGKNQDAGARGASAWRDNVDNMFMCAADRKQATGECSNRCLSIAKYRDGPEGTIGGYEFKFIELGLDEDGEPFDAPAIVFTGKSESGKPAKRPTQTQKEFDDALNNALITHGKDIRVRGDGPKVTAVDVQCVRSEFFRRHATGEPDENKQREASRKAFSRELQKIEGRYGRENRDGVEWIWRL